MTVAVKIGAGLKGVCSGEHELPSEGVSVGCLLDRMDIKDSVCDKSGAIRRHINVHINEGVDVRFLDGLSTEVKDGDVVTILTAIAGG